MGGDVSGGGEDLMSLALQGSQAEMRSDQLDGFGPESPKNEILNPADEMQQSQDQGALKRKV